MVRTRDAWLLDVLQPLGDRSPAVVKREFAWRVGAPPRSTTKMSPWSLLGRLLDRALFMIARMMGVRPPGLARTGWPPP